MPEGSLLDTPGQRCRLPDPNPKVPKKSLKKRDISSDGSNFHGLVPVLAAEEVVWVTASLGRVQENSGTGSVGDGKHPLGWHWLC